MDLKKQVYQINTLYALNLHIVICELYLNEKSKKSIIRKKARSVTKDRRVPARGKIQWAVQQRAEEMLVGHFRTPHKNSAFSLATNPKSKWLGYLIPTPCPAVWVNPGETLCTHVHSDQEVRLIHGSRDRLAPPLQF